MDVYSELLRKAAREIVQTYPKRDAPKRISGGPRAMLLPLDFYVKELEQFEPIT